MSITATKENISKRHSEFLAEIDAEDSRLLERFAPKMSVNQSLGRALVSFQANRDEVGHRWCKYREGFSASLVRYLVSKIGISEGTILDPFAGSGTTLLTAAELGLASIGIELLPSGAEIIKVRRDIFHGDKIKLSREIRKATANRQWTKVGERLPFEHLRITRGAFSPENELQLERFLFESTKEEQPLLRQVLRFAAMCVLEDISFTRKDGQYLRWDQRSGRGIGKRPFDKGTIRTFNDAISEKLIQIANDIEGRESQATLFDANSHPKIAGKVDFVVGSCLDIVPQIAGSSISGIITSPPYCNRYDYTRTYALELAMLGIDEEGVRQLRQTMLSCTVENKDKTDLRQKFGEITFQRATKCYESHRTLQLIIEYLDLCKRDKAINNPGIVRMVKNYFFELALLIFSSIHTLKPGAPFVMVNDNVRYNGAHIPVDLILSDFAENAGFDVEAIWVLPRGKGNSSQQMGIHGRREIRKCVYVWRKR